MVFCRLRYRLTLRDLSEIMLLRGFTVSHECVRQWEAKLLPVIAQLGTATSDQPSTAAAVITVSVDSTFIRSREEGERHMEVRVGNVETASGGRQVFGAVAKADTDISMLIHQSLRAVGRTDDTEVTAFTDGCPGHSVRLRGIRILVLGPAD